MAGKQLEKQIEKALEDLERWLKRQPAWKHGNLRSASGAVASHRSPSVLGESDCVLQFARFLNKHGVPWRDIHISVTPGQWLVDKKVAGHAPPRIDLAIVDRDRLLKRKAPLRRHKQEDFLFDAVFEFTLAGSQWVRTLKSGRPAQPPKAAARAIEKDAARVRRYLDDLWARRGYVVVVEEADHGWERPPAASDNFLSVHYLQCF